MTPEMSSLIERGIRYFPNVRPQLFEEREEWSLYFAMIMCKEEQDACEAKGDYLGMLRAVAKLT